MKNYLKSILVITILFISACNKDENNISGNSTSLTTSITGRILDENGVALVGVNVNAGGKATQTDIWGIYYLEGIQLNKKRDLVRVSYQGRWNHVCGFIPSSSLNYLNIYLPAAPTLLSVDANTGGLLNLPGNATVSFPANAFSYSSGLSYTGAVKVETVTLSPDQDNFELSAPGGDFLGTRTNGDDVLLLSYGMVGIKLFDNNNQELQMASGKMATLTFPIIQDFQSAAPTTIPLWHLDENSGLWIEEGSAVRSGNIYSGQVSHFTFWNYDDARPYFTVHGRVANCFDVSLPNILVSAHSQTPNSGGHGNSDANGQFSGYAPANEVLNIKMYGFTHSTLPPQAALSDYTIPVALDPGLITQCGVTYSGFIRNCAGQAKIATVLFLDSLDKYLGHCFSSSNGSFSYTTPPGKVKIVSYNTIFYTSLDTNVNQSQYANVGNLYLCDTTNLSNNFQLTFQSPLGNIPISFEVSSCDVNQGTIHIEYTDSSNGVSSDFSIVNPQYAIGNYNWNGTTCTIQGEVIYNGTTYTIYPSTQLGSTSITAAPGIGANVIGTFSGPVTLSGTGVPSIPGTLSGSFNVFRNN